MNPAGKLTSIIAGMAAGAHCIDDLDVIRSGGVIAGRTEHRPLDTELSIGLYSPERTRM